MQDHDIDAYVERQVTLIWGHFGRHPVAARCWVATQIMCGAEPVDDLWQQYGIARDRRRWELSVS
jgi:hypothetical protein